MTRPLITTTPNISFYRMVKYTGGVSAWSQFLTPKITWRSQFSWTQDPTKWWKCAWGTIIVLCWRQRGWSWHGALMTRVNLVSVDKSQLVECKTHSVSYWSCQTVPLFNLFPPPLKEIWMFGNSICYYLSSSKPCPHSPNHWLNFWSIAISIVSQTWKLLKNFWYV